MDSWLPFLRVLFMIAAFVVARVLWPIALKYPQNRLIDWMASIASLAGVALLLGMVGDLTDTPNLAAVGSFTGFGAVGVLLMLINPLAARIARTQRTAKKLTESDERLPAEVLEGLARGQVYDTGEMPVKRV